MGALTRRSILFLALLVCQAGCALPLTLRAALYQPAPIPAGTEAPTGAEFREAFQRFQRRTLDEAYQRFSERSPAYDEAALRYVEAWRARFANAPGAASADSLAADGRRLVALGCEDPLILYLLGTGLQDSGNLRDAEHFLRRAVEGFKQSNHPRARAAYAALRLSTVCSELGGEKEREARRQRSLAVRWVVESARDGSYAQEDHRVMLSILTDLREALPVEAMESIYTQLKEAPTVHPYVRDVLGGLVHMDEAWEARGSGWARTVTEEGWRGFAENLGQARSLLTAAWKAHPEYPEAPAHMIRVTMGGHGSPGDTERRWFDRAVSAQMDFMLAYDYLLRAMLPRWGGSPEAIYDFGVECLETQRFDTYVPFFFFRCVNTIAGDFAGDPVVWERPATRRRLEAMFEGYERERRDRGGTDYRSLHAAVAWFTKDWQRARSLMEELGDDLDGYPFGEYFGVHYAVARAQTYALTGARGEQLAQAERAYEAGNLARAVELYEEALRMGEPRANAERYTKHRLATLRLEHEFSQGDWVALKPDSIFSGWMRPSGDWAVEPDGSLKGTLTEGLWTRCEADFGSRLELRGQIDFVSAAGAEADACIALRCPPQPQRDDVMFVLYKDRGRASLSHSLWEEETTTVPCSVRDRNTFLIQVWDSQVNVEVNGERVFTGQEVEQLFPGGRKQIGMGATYLSSDVTLRFRDLEVRKLTASPRRRRGA
jgi:hypothetical protein